MSKEKDQQIHPEDNQNSEKSSVPDADQNQPLQPNKTSDKANDDFMKPFISNKADQPEDAKLAESEAETTDGDRLSKIENDQAETSSDHHHDEVNDADVADDIVEKDNVQNTQQAIEDDVTTDETETAETSSETLPNVDEDVNTESDDASVDDETTLVSEPVRRDEERMGARSNEAVDNNEATLIAEPVRKDEDESPLTDEEAKEEEKQKRKDRRREKKGRIRLIPIWVRLVFVIAALLGSLALGAMVGYGIVGEGGNPRDVFEEETWYHIYDMIFDGTERER